MKASIYIKPETFIAASADVSEVGEWYAGRINGKVVVQYGHEEVTTWARRYEDGSVYAYGFVGRYRTGNKNWAVNMSVSPNRGNQEFTSIWFGRDDRAGNFHKQNCISFAPQTFFQL